MISRPKPARTPSLSERVLGKLRAEILSCEIEPGAELSEAELAVRFGVSKTPVREALATLRLEGFVETYPRRGYRAAPLTFKAMNELFELRACLEASAAEFACARITDRELTRLEHLVSAAYDRVQGESIRRFIEANRAFHLAIADSARNERLARAIRAVLEELDRFFYLGARLRDVSDETVDDHRIIVERLKARDTAGVREAIVRHAEVTRIGLVTKIASSRQSSLLVA